MKNNVLSFPDPRNANFQCPLCLKIVSARDFITSYQLIDPNKLNKTVTTPSYQIKNLCRSCRDSGQ
jgi:hypothetical protein